MGEGSAITAEGTGMTLYDVLGVTRGATDTHIRAAYRRLVKAHHPDKGGDRAKFEQVQRAYDVLMDAERRAKYDATGDDGDKPLEDPIDVMALGLIGQLLMSIANQDVNVSIRNDCVQVMRSALMKQKLEHEKNIAMAGRITANIVRLRERFRRKATDDQDNRLQAILKAQLATIEVGRQQLVGAVESCNRAMTILDEYRFDAEAAQAQTFSPGLYSALGLGTGRFP
jgi:curved DNA-binding protein CbpA